MDVGSLAEPDVPLAVWALPDGSVRDQYRHEFLAELYGMSSAQELRHASNLLARSIALCRRRSRPAALDPGPSTLEFVMPIPLPRKPLLCRLNVHHKWVRRFNPDGEDYLQCKACGEDLYDVERASGPNIGGNIAGGIMSGIGI
jgi:hypothetical protein